MGFYAQALWIGILGKGIASEFFLVLGKGKVRKILGKSTYSYVPARWKSPICLVR